MEQKTVKLLQFRAENHNCIKTIMLTPDIMSKQLLVLVGESGNGKSTLIELLQTAIGGTDGIKKKDVLEKGYLTEVLLLDGEIKLYAGAKVTEYQRGQNAGEAKFETFLYAKDANGKNYIPLIDGVEAKAGDYVKMLTTELTFNMPALFSENQTIHRGLIEKLFKTELDALGPDEVAAKIIELKKKRDASRMLCQNQGAYMEQFEKDGFTEVMLASIKPVDIKAINERITQKRIELDRMVNGSDTAYELAVEKLKAERAEALQKIKDEVLEIREKIRRDGEEKQATYAKLKDEYGCCLAANEKSEKALLEITQIAETCLSKTFQNTVQAASEIELNYLKNLAPTLPVLAPADPTLSDAYAEKSQSYLTLDSTPLPLPEKGVTDTTILDKEIAALEISRKSAEETNSLYNRFQLWQEWIKAQHDYDKQIDILRAMYANIDCGVEGMRIVPTETESGRVEVWIQYDGSYDTEFYHNKDKELRFIFQYSSFQRAALGVMLQAARLNLKPKALRLAIVDDVAFTEKGLAVLAKMCEDFNVQLITSKTDDYDKANIGNGEIIVENGEIFFNQ
jgi:energy-coupling factor transporter ATP-binding protein EcfA2